MSKTALAILSDNEDRRYSQVQTGIERRQIANFVMNSIGECAYEWDIESDRLHWSEGTEQLLCLNSVE